MPYRNESKLMTQDAPADVSTELCFNPPNGPFDGESAESKVTGTLTSKFDVDWIALEMSEGKEYTLTLAGSETLTDTRIRLLDSKGNEIMALDDIDMDGNGVADSLHPVIKFTPEAGSGTQKYHIEVSAFTGNPGTNVITAPAAWTLTADEMALPDPTDGAVILGGMGDDKLRGTPRNDTISGAEGNDSLSGNAGDDVLNGGDGADLLSGGPGADEINGGDGTDTLDYSDSQMGVTINLTDGTARGGDADGDTIGSDIENVRGSMHDDTLTGTRGDNSIWGLGGDDELDGGRRDDTLFGGAGDDDLDGGAGDDTLIGGYGADTLTGGTGADTVSYVGSLMGVTVRLHSQQAMGGDAEGDVFADTFTTSYTNEDGDEVEVTLPDFIHLTGSGMADILAGDFRDNTIMGGGGDDKIYGGPSPADAHEMSGITNMDTLMGQGGDDTIFGGAGADTLMGGAGNDVLNGGPGVDTAWGGRGSDLIHADADDVNIYGNRPNDDTTSNVDESIEMVGEVDTVSYARLEDGVTRTLGATTGDFILAGIENAIGSQGDDTITGADGVNNVIEGGEGGDTLNGGPNSENTVSYEGSDDWVRVDLNSDPNTPGTISASRGHASGDELSNFANIRGSAHDDELDGDDNANKLWGLAGDDEINADGGGDTVEGGAGADEMDGGDGIDTLSYAGSDAGVTVNLATASVSGGHATGDTIETEEVDHDGDNTTEDDATEAGTDEDVDTDDIDVSTFEHVTGSMHDDRITGDHRMNVLNGGAGDDVLRGGAEVNVANGTDPATVPGGDHLIGGPGADVLDGGESGDDPDTAANEEHIDWAVYRDAAVDEDTMAGVTVNLATRRGEAGEAMGDTLINIELVWGSRGNDVFKASEGPDWVHGDTGMDTMSYELSDLGVTVDLATTGDQDGTAFDPDDPATGPQVANLGTPIAYIVNGTEIAFAADVSEDNREDNTNGAAGDRLGGIENLTGSAQNDTLGGDDSANVLKGGGGNDTLSGAGGNDRLEGGAGDDTLNGGDETDPGDGAMFGDTIHGGAGDDTINAGDGEDIINGGAGDDDLSGGDDTDTDTFVFSPDDGAGSDIIMDWEEQDRIDLSAYNLTAQQVAAAISVRGEQVIINLEPYGGGRITLDDLDSVNTFDQATDDTATPNVNEETDDVVQMLEVVRDTDSDGVDDTGVFII